MCGLTIGSTGLTIGVTIVLVIGVTGVTGVMGLTASIGLTAGLRESALKHLLSISLNTRPSPQCSHSFVSRLNT